MKSQKKEYRFQGWETADAKPVNSEYKGIGSPKDLYDALSGIWCLETCPPRLQSQWTKENNTVGQCSITAFLAQDIFGGKVYGVLLPDGSYHCFNVMDNSTFDLTSEQFGGKRVPFEEGVEQFREVHFADEGKKARYELLKKRLKEKLESERPAECLLKAAPGYEIAFEHFEPNLKEFYRNPLPWRMDPFRIYGNLYYVGNQKVCMHLIDTGEGLILFDTGYGNDFYLLLESIRMLGFDPKDVKIVIHSHGHFDHFGGGNAMRELFGSRIYMSRVDTQLIRQKPERALCELGPMKYTEICWPDEEIEDGQIITLGNTSIRCVLTPGHTYGTMTFFFDAVDENGRKLHAGYMGGCGLLTVYRKYCRRMELPEEKLEQMEKSIRKIYNEPVDITLGNHPNQNNTVGKRKWMLLHEGENPFINPDGWHIFLDELEARRSQLAESALY